MHLFVALSAVVASTVVAPATTVCSVADHNAVGDGKTYDTAAIEAALKQCALGGTVLYSFRVMVHNARCI